MRILIDANMLLRVRNNRHPMSERAQAAFDWMLN